MALSISLPIPPFPAAPAGNPAGNALLAQVLPTNPVAAPRSPLLSQAPAAAQGSADTFTAQYAPETYAVALASTSVQTLEPTYGGTNLPLIDHELQKIEAAYQGTPTLLTPPPTFAVLDRQADQAAAATALGASSTQ